jgi:hypothetical protein
MDALLGLALCALVFFLVVVVAGAVDWLFRHLTGGPDILGPRKRRGGRD